MQFSGIFSGLYTAIVTPFDHKNNFDEASFKKLIEHQIAGNVDGIVVLGTTGESPTIGFQEHHDLIKKTVDIVDGRTQVIVGAGSNCTREAIGYSQTAQASGADGLLHVTPYYNKPTQEGIYQHFTEISKNTDLPIMLYNIAGRCGVNIETESLLRLAEHKNIVSVKEASGSLEQMKEVINSLPEGFTVLSGDDNLTLDLMKMGGHGVVSVLSNIIPNEMKNLINLCNSQNWDESQKIHNQLSEMFELCFIEANPQPIKTLLSHESFCEKVFRLPMVKMLDKNEQELLEGWARFKKSI